MREVEGRDTLSRDPTRPVVSEAVGQVTWKASLMLNHLKGLNSPPWVSSRVLGHDPAVVARPKADPLPFLVTEGEPRGHNGLAWLAGAT